MFNADLTTLQFQVLEVLGPSERSGKEVRERLAAVGISKTLASFYQMMARLEEGGFVTGSYRQIQVEGQTVKERRYRITGTGIKAWQEMREFFASRPATVFGAKGGPRHA